MIVSRIKYLRVAVAAYTAMLFLLAAAGDVHSLERKLTLSLTKEIFYTLASDNIGEKNTEMIARIIGLSPAIKKVYIKREGNFIIMELHTTAEEVGKMKFSLVFDKMDVYKLAMAARGTADIETVTDRLRRRDKYIKSISYRTDINYSIFDLELDVDKYLDDIKEEESRQVTAPKKKPPEKVKKKIATPQPTQLVKKPAKKPPPSKIKEPEKQQPEPQSIMVRKVRREPLIDGRLDETSWSGIDPLKREAEGPKGKMIVSIMAVHDGKNIYFAFSWPDSTKGIKHKPWIWSESGRDYEASTKLEDGIAIQFSDMKLPDCMISGQEAKADLWHWRAGRTDPSGFAEDSRLVLSRRKLPQANSYQSIHGGSVWIKIFPDDGRLPYRSQILVLKKEEEEPRYLSQKPSGSAADVRAKSLWKKGVWTVEMSRKLSTGNEDDVTFESGEKDYYLSVSVFDSSEGRDHYITKLVTMNLE